MPSSLRLVVQLVLLAFAWAVPAGGMAQNAFVPLAQNYAIAGSLPGDELFPDLAISAEGGYVVWQDNFCDGEGFGINARRVNSSFSGELATFRINETAAEDQEHPRVALLNDGGAAFVWQGGRPGFQTIYARFLAPNGIFLTGDIAVSSVTNWQEIQPAVAALADDTVVVVWTRFGDAKMQDVYAQRFSAVGQKLGTEFKVNRFDDQNQRRPAVAALANGDFAVAWVTEYVSNTRVEQFNSTNAVTASAIVYCRVFNPSGMPVTDDVRVGLSTEPFCANPAVAGLPGGGFTVVWNQIDTVEAANSWDIFGRAFTAGGVTNGLPFRINAVTYGDQFAPGIAGLGSDQLVTWTSLGQDGSMEGVYARFLRDGALDSAEMLVNTNNTISRQMQPTVAADGAGRFLVAWSSYTGLAAGCDLHAQRYVGTRISSEPPPPPYVFALSSTELLVSWPELAGFYDLAHYELFLGNDPNPVPVTQNYLVLNGLSPGTAYHFFLAYRFTDGRRSPLSTSAKASTWGHDGNGDGLPDTWQQMYWGPDPAGWLSPNLDADGDGANNLTEFLTGTDPLDPASVLRTRLTMTVAGGRLSWNSQPGNIYQVQKSINFSGWADYGSPRFAAGTTDSVAVEPLNGAEFYRVIRVR